MTYEPQVYVGRKHVSEYINKCLVFFHSGYDRVKVRGRGWAIPKAIEVVERLRKHFMRNVEIEKVEIGSEMVPSKKGYPRRVSIIVIVLRRREEW